MDLSSLHAELATRLRELELDRDSPALLIEHGCTGDRLHELTTCVAEALAVHDLYEPFWRSRYLPLLLIATEVGYEFGEDRHEYWPRLGERLELDFVRTDWRCTALSDLYLGASAVRPPQTEWARHFNRIALPVTHALLPKWLHEPLLALLLDCPLQVQAGGAYFHWMTSAAARDPKLAMLMHSSRESLAREVIEGILEVSEPRLVSSETLERFRRDVYATPSTRAKLREARARQPLLRPAPAPLPTSSGGARTAPTPVRVPLTLSFAPLALAIAPVTLGGAPPASADSIRLYPLAERRPTSLSALLRDGAPLARPLPNADEGPIPIFDERLAELPGPLRLQLSALRVHVCPPLLFSDRRGAGGVATQVLDGAFGPTEGWWVLVAEPPSNGDGIETLGQIGGLTCVRVDASHADADAWLSGLGFKRMTTPALRLVGAAPLDGPAGRLYDPEDTVGITVEGGRVLCDRTELTDGLYLLPGAGERLFENPAGAAPARLTIARAALPPRLPDVRVELAGEAPSVDALRARRVALRVSGRAALVGLRARVAVEAGDTVLAEATTARLPALPCAIPAEDPVWRTLAERIPTDRPVALRVEVGAIGRARWWLQPEIAEVSWRDEEALGERPIVGYRSFNASAPLVEVAAPGGLAPIHLKIPRYADGEGAPGSGLCVAPRRLVLDDTAPTPPSRITRDWQGIRPLLEGLQAWSTARTEHLLAEAARKRTVRTLEGWVERALCGGPWCAAREAIPRPSTVGDHLATQLRRNEVDAAEEGWGDARKASLYRSMSRALEEASGWLRSMADAEIDTGELAPLLDEAYRAVGCDDADPSCEPEATREALRAGFAEFDAQIELRPLLVRILPQSKRAALAGLAYADAGDEELVDALTDWLRSSSLVAPWPREQVRTLLGIWLWPTRTEVRETLFERTLADQLGARAVRYAVLRRRGAGR